MNQTLDDIIKTRRLVSRAGGGAKGKFNSFRSTGPGPVGSRLGLTTKKTGRVFQDGPKVGSIASRLGDARIKIIAKKRQNLVDARDQLNEIARQSDAREKLTLLRANKVTAKPKSLFTKALGNLKGGGGGVFSKQRNQGGFVTKRQKVQSIPLHKLTRTVQLAPEPVPRSYLQMGRLGHAEPLHDIDVEVYNDLDAVERMSPPSRRERLPDYDELLAMYAKNKMQRAPITRAPITRAPITRAPVSQPPVSKRPVASYQTHQNVRKAGTSGMRMDQYYQEESEEEEDEEMDMDEIPHQATNMGRTLTTKPTNVFRRVQNPAPAPVRAATSYKKPVAQGYRVRISNLAPSVTKDDIMELFSDPGPLHNWDLLSGGIAEVFYKKRSDAIRAVDAYHKRLLDGHPMTVTFYDH